MEMWNGHRYTRDTISRGTQHADSGISMLGGMTPQSLHWYLADANKKSGLDDGLLQRFQLSVLPDQQDWKDIDRLPNYEAMEQAKATYARLLALDPARPLQFCFDQEAQQLFKAWLRELETRLRGDELHPALVSHLSKYRSLMPSLALLFRPTTPARRRCHWSTPSKPQSGAAFWKLTLGASIHRRSRRCDRPLPSWAVTSWMDGSVRGESSPSAMRWKSSAMPTGFARRFPRQRKGPAKCI
jgi:hypothetical protein